MDYALPATDKWNHRSHFYDMQLLAYIGAIFDPMRAVVDVGANVGFVARFLALRCKSRVVAYEPSLENYRALVRNTKGLSNVVCIRQAVGSKTSRVTFLDNATVCSHVVGSKSRSKNLRRVLMVTLDGAAEIAAEDVGLIKIDVEGHEVRVLEGTRQTIQRCRPIVVLETMDRWLKRQGDSVEAIVEFFRSLGGYQKPVNKFGQTTVNASDLVFAPDGIYLHRPYVSFRKQEKRQTCS